LLTDLALEAACRSNGEYLSGRQFCQAVAFTAIGCSMPETIGLIIDSGRPSQMTRIDAGWNATVMGSLIARRARPMSLLANEMVPVFAFVDLGIAHDQSERPQDAVISFARERSPEERSRFPCFRLPRHSPVSD